MIKVQWTIEWEPDLASGPGWKPVPVRDGDSSIKLLWGVFGGIRIVPHFLQILAKQADLAIAGQLPDDGLFNEDESITIWHGVGHVLIEDAMYLDIPELDSALLMQLSEFKLLVERLESIRVAPADDELPGFELEIEAKGAEARALFRDARLMAGLPEELAHDPDITQMWSQ